MCAVLRGNKSDRAPRLGARNVRYAGVSVAPKRSMSVSRLSVSLRVVKDQTETVPLTRSQPAHAVANVNAVVASSACNRTPSIRKDDELTLFNRYRLGASLHAWTLLGQQELAADIVAPALTQHTGGLQREGYLAVQVLMHAVVIAGFISKHKRSRQRLLFPAAGLKKLRERRGKSLALAETLRPAVGDLRERRIEMLAQFQYWIIEEYANEIEPGRCRDTTSG